ncbi:MAG TPA: hypothetical protein V6C72_18760, partial [Chroococcales cyanobacterium]
MKAENDINLQKKSTADDAAGADQPGTGRGAGWSVFERASSSTLAQILVLAALVLICYGRTVTSYFLADDFGEVSYTSRIFNGEPGLLWSNWTGNYMQIPGMNVYRPWLLMSLVFDYLIYHANAWGYYVTNLVYFTGCVLLLYCATRLLTKRWGHSVSKTCAFFTAAFFGLNPLRCESISWVVGRVDIICCFFYLASLVLFLLSRERWKGFLVWLGISSF